MSTVAEKTASALDGQTGFVPDLDQILATSKSRSNAGGSKIRANVSYVLVAAAIAKLANQNVPKQEQVILTIMNKALSKDKPNISEPELHKLIVSAHAAGVLTTKQDPWHIFRYYRTDLVKRGVLKAIDTAVAPPAKTNVAA